jgi:hypothetical protein
MPGRAAVNASFTIKFYRMERGVLGLAAGRQKARRNMLQHIVRRHIVRHHIVRHLGKVFLPALVIAASLSAAPATEPAGLATQSATLRVATVLCGSNGCTPVQTKQVKRQKFQTMGHG